MKAQTDMGLRKPCVKEKAEPRNFSSIRGRVIARNQNTHAKRQREVEKRAKADAKRQRREQRKDAPPGSGDVDPEYLTAEDVDGEDMSEPTKLP